MKTTLDNIAEIKTGLFAKPESKGQVVYLQARDFDENGKLLSELFPGLKNDESVKNHLLQPGDVLFAAKGTKNFATVYEIHNQTCVASTSFFVIRIKETKLLPDYLAWSLNHPDIQSHLKMKAKGTSIPSITKSVLEKVELSIPPVETQHLILEIIKLKEKEKTLKKRIDILKDQKVQQIIMKAINQIS